MIRFRWFHCEWPIPIHEIATMLMANSFNYDTGRGFKLDKTRLNHISGKYLVRHEIEDNVDDPITGSVTTSQRIVYEVINFNLSSSKPAIEVINPPRSLIGFISALGDAIKSNITINNVEIDLESYLDLLKKHLKKTKITMVDCSNVIIDLNTSAKLMISGSDDVRGHLKELILLRKHKIDKARISYMNQAGVTSCFDVTGKGTAKIADRDAEELLPILKECMSSLCK